MSDLTASAQHTDAGVPGGTPTGTGTPPAQSEAPKATLTQEQFNAALAEEKRKWKQAQEAQVAEAARKAAETEAAAKGQWEQLANERAAKLEAAEREREQHSTRVESLTAAMEAQIKARAKALPEELRDLLIEGDVLTRFDQLGKLEAAAAKLAPVAARPPMRTPPGPGSAGSTTTIQPADVVATKRNSGEYAL